MAQGNGAAVQVNLLVDAVQQPQILDAGQRLGGKGLIQFKQIDVLYAQAGTFQRQFAGRYRAITHNGWIATDYRHRTDPGAGFQAERLGARLAHQQHGGCAVG
ncbi:hypothetical protein D3C79_908700 [compost metagenome]